MASLDLLDSFVKDLLNKHPSFCGVPGDFVEGALELTVYAIRPKHKWCAELATTWASKVREFCHVPCNIEIPIWIIAGPP